MKTSLFFLICLLALKALGQQYPITSLDGSRQQIRIRFEYPNFDLRLYCAKDTITIPRVRAIKSIRYLSSQLLAIEYPVVAGSGEHVECTSIYCVRKGRLIMIWNGGTLEKDNVYNHRTKKFYDVIAYHASLKLLGNVQAHSVRLVVIQKHHTDTLRFNDALGCFYNSYKSLDTIQRVCIGDSDIHKVYFKGSFPAITFQKKYLEIFTTDGYYYWNDSLWRRQVDCLPF